MEEIKNIMQTIADSIVGYAANKSEEE